MSNILHHQLQGTKVYKGDLQVMAKYSSKKIDEDLAAKQSWFRGLKYQVTHLNNYSLLRLQENYNMTSNFVILTI